jgi:NAD(P)-dependent dehydrogenase (short-subunit alcohol dehydrogenase family)
MDGAGPAPRWAGVVVVLITGCSSGFGLLAAVEAARRGHVVYAGVREPARADGLRAAAGSLLDDREDGAAPAPDDGTVQRHPLDAAGDRSGGCVRVVRLDVTRADHRDAVVARILADTGRIDALVNNAGVALGGFLETVDEDELRAVLETNVIAPWALTKAVLPAMRARRAGRIVMVGSMSGRVAFPGVGAYAASKFALEGLSEAWRHELALFGVQVLMVEPAQFKTDIFGRNRTLARRAEAEGPWLPFARHLDGVVRGMVERRAGDPEVVGRLIVDLLEQERPRFRHPVGPNVGLRLALANLAPFWLTERVVGRFLAPPKG